MRNLKRFTVLLALVTLTSAGVLATPIQGALNITGDVTVTATTIDFLPAAGGTGDFTISGTSSGIFSGLGGTTGTLMDMVSTVQQVGPPIDFSPYVTVTALPTLDWHLTRVDPGTFGSGDCGLTAAAGQTCTPPGPPTTGLSPFNLTNLKATSSAATFGVQGFINDPSTPMSPDARFNGVFSAQFPSQSFQDVLAVLGTQGSVTTSFSASFTVTSVPEPVTFALMGLGLVGLGFIRRFRKVRKP